MAPRADRQRAARSAKREAAPGLWARIKAVFTGRSAYAYEGASESRTRRGWTRSNQGPNTVASWAPTLRARARDLVRNDAHAARAVQAIVGNVIGTGIEPRFVGDTADGVRAQWRRWARRCDVSGRHGFDALQLQACRALYVDGEAFIVRRWRRGRSNPLRLELLEADMLDESKSAVIDGGRVIQGVEVADSGEVVAYHFRVAHPGETLAGMSLSIETVRIPAADVIHLYMPLRPQQMRGISFLAPAMTAKVDLGDFERFHLTSKKMESLITGWVVPSEQAIQPGPDTDPELGLEVDAVDADGNSIERLEPGMLGRLKAGTDIRFSTPSLVQGYSDFKTSLLQTIAVGWGVTYELMTGDLSKVNYSSLRAGLLEFWRFVDQLQWQCVIPALQRVEEWFADSLALTGVLRNSDDMQVEWVPPKRHQVDPSKDLLADYLRARGGLAPLPDIMQEHGYSVEDIKTGNEEAFRVLDAAGIVLDIDPRNYQWRGAAPVNVAPLPSAPETTEES